MGNGVIQGSGHEWDVREGTTIATRASPPFRSAYVCASSRDKKSKIDSDGTTGRKYRRGGDERGSGRGNQERNFYQK